MKNLTDFRKMVETGVDPRLTFVRSLFENVKFAVFLYSRLLMDQ